jgi:signal transduction histidine kinase
MTLEPTYRSTLLKILFALLALAIPAFLLFEGYRWYIFNHYQSHLETLIPAVLLSLAFWMIGFVLVLRFFHRREARLLSLLSQTLGIALFIPMAYPDPRAAPFSGLTISVIGLHLSAPLLFHFHITFPVSMGNAAQRRNILSALYLVASLASVAWLTQISPLWQASTVYTMGLIFVAIGVLIFAYRRRATADGRRRLRVIVFGTLLPVTFVLLFDMLPTLMGLPYRFPTWFLAALLIFNPLGYAYAIARQDVFGVDRLLNRSLVYIILSMGIFVLYLGPFLLLYRLLPGNILLQLIVVSAVTLFVGWTFDWARKNVQRWVDRLFYGGWYDYPGVVETISDALARCVEREQISYVLTRQVPELMNLQSGNLWIGESNATFPSTPPVLARFRFQFQSDEPAQWTVGSHLDGDDLSDSDRRILNTLARQAEIALNNILLIETLRRQLDEIQDSRETLAQTQRQLLRTREDERARLARELHDNPIQSLVGMNIQLGLLQNTEKIPSLLLNTLGDMRAEVRELTSELRQVCANLRPPMLDALGLGAALRVYAEDWSAETEVGAQLDLEEDVILRQIPNEVALNFYRVAQEALTNVARHARARQVVIKLHCKQERLSLLIRDNGCGFTLPDTFSGLTKKDHFGVVGMRERVDLIGGEWKLESAPGMGTSIEVTWEKA